MRAAEGILVVGLALATPACGGGADARPDVVLVTLDTLRPDFLGFLGAPRETAPFLAELAARSVVCEGAVSTSSWTAPATASLFTGTYPDRHGLTRGLFAQKLRDQDEPGSLRLRGLRPSLATLPELFAEAGYATFGVSANPNVDAALGFARGFERFECRPRAGAESLLEVLDGWRAEVEVGDPSFVYVHLNDVHSPYDPRAPWCEPAAGEADPRRAYESEISWLDARLGELFERYGWAEEAVVMVVSDHGEEFGEHGGEGHGYSLHGELSRALLLFRAPRADFAPARVRAAVSLIDALPTLLELAGVEGARGFDGRSLAALGDAAARAGAEAALEGRTLLAHRSNYAGTRALWSATDGAWKLIVEEGGAARLYDLARDPDERAPLASDADARGAALELAVRDLRARAATQQDYEAVEIELGGELGEDLRNLGYVDGR